VPTTDDAFERAYAEHLPAVSGYLYRRVERRFVEDLAADVFAVAWRRRASVTAGEELPWLYRIAANLVANHRRKQATGVAPRPGANSVHRNVRFSLWLSSRISP
jgi:RNA polymerase sigma-70 factor (ECF subfamily)